jgi:hypothetical protein
MPKFLRWFFHAFFPNSRLANRQVQVSRREYLALQREVAESDKYAMGDTIKPQMFYKNGNLRPAYSDHLHDSVQLSNEGTRLDGTKIEELKND